MRVSHVMLNTLNSKPPSLRVGPHKSLSRFHGTDSLVCFSLRSVLVTLVIQPRFLRSMEDLLCSMEAHQPK